jgi:PQQ enzyme repeat
VPTWAFDSASTAPPDGGPPQQYHDLVLEPDGQVSISGFFTSPAILRANTSAVAAPQGGSRRCILWNGHLVCADYPQSPNGRVTALDLSTGATRWSYDIRVKQPALVALTGTVFLARLVVQGNDRLAALYEAYPFGSAGDTQCRLYFLVVIDASGREVMAQQVVDPLLAECVHPHPYGVASDSVGNLYIAFSPTHSTHAPLFPDTPTLLISFSHDGLFRWKRLETTLRGGELAIARGLLYPENSQVVLDAPTGQAQVALPLELGRAVISDSRLIPAPTAGGTTLSAFEAGQSQLRWSHTLPTGWTFWSDQLRLAQWSTSQGPRTVATTFVADATDTDTVYRLYAVDVHNGLAAFSCQVALPTRTPPQLFEVANGSLAVMNGALDGAGRPGCGKCDPPFASSSAAFQTLSTPGLSVAQEPWGGTFGGADHDHHED